MYLQRNKLFFGIGSFSKINFLSLWKESVFISAFSKKSGYKLFYYMIMKDTSLMPVLFVGHGSPMNALEDNEFTQTWTEISAKLPKPQAIVCISAHWETKGTYVTGTKAPKTIHDFYGFPSELYEQNYPTPGSPELARYIVEHVKDVAIEENLEWGLDHGAWAVLKYLYPQADIPVVQISIDPLWHYELGKQLSFLRTKGVLVIGSGNMIHNLRIMRFSGSDFNAESGYDWAFEINELFKRKIEVEDFESLINYQSLHKDIKLAIPTTEHYLPLLYVLGMKKQGDLITVFNDKVIAGSLSMTSIMIN